MEEDTESTEKSSIDSDPRFEVKWRKKESSTTSAVPTVEAAGTGEDVATLRRQLAEAEERVAGLQDRWQRTAADLANLRKRTEQERAEVEKFASMMLVAELLPVLDNFERALATIPGNLAMLTWIQGVMLIQRHFQAILERQGVAPVETENQQFNPHLHEAISERETDEAAAGSILQVYQKGYTMHGHVIRPALVELAKAPAAAGEEETPTKATSPSGEDVAAEAAAENTGP